MKAHKACLWITLGLTAAFFLFAAAWTVGRVYSFRSPTFDFGIFSQMFYYLKESGLPMTTVERDGLLSHSIRISIPIYYLMLPFYLLVPTPATLQVLQAAALAFAVLPLWKLGKHHGLTGSQRMLLCALLLLYPAYSGGISYDLHENCFLTPLILWLFYGIDKKNPAVIFPRRAPYADGKGGRSRLRGRDRPVADTQIPPSFRRADTQNLITGFLLLAVSLCWFFLATGYLASSGDGVMTSRYKNLMYNESSSLITVVKAVLLSPMKAVFECADTERSCLLSP